MAMTYSEILNMLKKGEISYDRYCQLVNNGQYDEMIHEVLAAKPKQIKRAIRVIEGAIC